MEYKQLGRTGLRVCRLCVGTMVFGRLAEDAEGTGNGERARRPLREVKTAPSLTRITDTEA